MVPADRGLDSSIAPVNAVPVFSKLPDGTRLDFADLGLDFIVAAMDIGPGWLLFVLERGRTLD